MRRTQAEVDAFVSAAGHVAWRVRLEDKFGDNGLVSALLLAPHAERGDTLDVDTWVMSCRVFGRQLEFEILNSVVRFVRELGVSALTGSYVPTAKNKPVAELYERLGFVRDSANAGADGKTNWILELDDFTPHGTYIETV